MVLSDSPSSLQAIPKLWSAYLSTDFRIIYGTDKRWEDYPASRPCAFNSLIRLQNAAKDVLFGDISGELIPFSDLKSHTNKYVLELWHSEWDEFPENNFHKIFSNLKDCPVCPRANRKKESVNILFAHWSFIYYTFFFIEGWGATNVHRINERLTIEHTCSDFIEIRQSHFTAQSLSYFKTLRWKRFLTFWKKPIFLKESKLLDQFWNWLCFTHFLSLF